MITIPTPLDSIVASYHVGSQIFPQLVTGCSDSDIFTLRSDGLPSYIAQLNASYSDRALLNLWIPESAMITTSDTWNAMVSNRASLLTKQRLQRLVGQAIVRLSGAIGKQTGKPLAEILRRAIQVANLVETGNVPFTFSDDVASVLVGLRSGNGDMDNCNICIQATLQRLRNVDWSKFRGIEENYEMLPN